MSEKIIQVDNLSVIYPGKTVLDDISFSVNRGEVLTVLGGSGSGKTTLMRHLIGLEKPAYGKIILNNVDITSGDEEEIKRAKTHLGVMFQSGALLSAMNLIENVMLPLQEHSDLDEDLIFSCALKKLMLVNLQEYAYYYPANISGGMIKRAAIARAMALDPAIIVLDEPGAGLDPITAGDIDQLIIQLSRSLNITFVVVTHELTSIQTIADKVILLNNAKIAAQGTLSEVMNTPNNDFIDQFFKRIKPKHQETS